MNKKKDEDLVKKLNINIRVTEDEMKRLKEAAKLESYSGYSEFIRRTALLEADKAILNAKNIQLT